MDAGVLQPLLGKPPVSKPALCLAVEALYQLPLPKKSLKNTLPDFMALLHTETLPPIYPLIKSLIS